MTTIRILVLLAVASVGTLATDLQEQEVNYTTLHNPYLPPYIPQPEPCENPELEAVILNVVHNLPPSLVPMFEMYGGGTDVLNIDSETIHLVACLYTGIHSLSDLEELVLPEFRPQLRMSYRMMVQYYQMIGGKDGIAHFLYEASELIDFLQEINFPQHDSYELSHVETWKFFMVLQHEKSEMWEMIYSMVPDTAPFVNFFRYSPEKLTRILTSDSGSFPMSQAMGGFIPPTPFPAIFTEEISNFLVAELEALDVLTEMGLFELS